MLAALWEITVLAVTGLYITQMVSYPASEQTFPRLIAYPVVALAAFSLLRRAFLAQRSRSAEDEQPFIDLHYLTLGVGLTALYAALWLSLGFVLDTGILMAAGPRLLGLNWKGVLACLGIAAGTVLLFGYLFSTSGSVTLPGGVLGVDIRW